MRVLILLSIVAVAFANQQCGENEHFESCGTACPLTCDNHDNPPNFCVAMCKVGCQCDEGFVKNGDGKCVRKLDCPPRTEQNCGANEQFDSCGTACPLTCDNHDNPPMICTKQCIYGCHCKPGFVRNSYGECVRKEECPPRSEQNCGANAEFQSCGTACPLTCENHENPPRICTLQCAVGCQCKKGFVRHSNGECVRTVECAPRTEQKCKANEEFDSCGTACPVTCDNYANPPKFCTKQCVIGCHCKPGFVRHKNGECVRAEECLSRNEPVCGENEGYTECGSACPLTCDNYNKEPEACIQVCVSGCACENGYVKTRDGRCVRPENCPRKDQQKSCTAKPDAGPCMAYFRKWYHDAETGECKEFVYGGCAGNGNRYSSEKECLENCKATAAVERAGISTDCLQEKLVGPCRAKINRWYFTKLGKCEPFVYGGCRGNTNNFESKEICESVCHIDAAPAVSVCLQEQVVGPCRAAFPRWFFNKQTGQCEKFIYGGCGGNDNNFSTKEECHGLCAASAAPTACLAEKVTGPCRGSFERWYFNGKTCEKFIYGGCQGNSNNFESEEDCHAVCAA